jgi:bacteriorhodopsin
MTRFSAGLLWWAPRLIGSLIALLLCYVVIDEGLQFGFGRDLGGVIIMILAAVVAVLVALAWRWAWFGTAAFGLMTLFFGGGPFVHPYLAGVSDIRPPVKLLFAAAVCIVLFGSIALLYWRSWKRRGVKAGQDAIVSS